MATVVQDVSSGLSGAEAALYGAIIAGAFTLLGVVIGLVMDRVLQRQGKVRCHMEPIEIWVLYDSDGGVREPITLHCLPIPAELLPETLPERAYSREVSRCFLKVKLFNEKEVRTGLRDVVVTFEGRRQMAKTMSDRSTWLDATGSLKKMETLDAVNLPSREWVTFSLVGSLELEEARKLTECDRAWLRGYFPDGSRFNERVPFAK